MRQIIFLIIAGLALLVFECPTFAEDAAAMIQQGDAAYAKREDIPQAKIALSYYEHAQAADSHQASAYWKAALATWWLGENAESRTEKLDYFEKSVAFAQQAVNVDSGSVAAHFWLGASEGSYGEVKGILKSLSLVKPMRHEMAEVIRLNDHYENGGAYRVLAVIDYKVPGFAGGSKKRAKQELDKALAMGPNDPYTHYYLAEFYYIMDEPDQAKAEVTVLQTLQVAPDDLPELHLLQKQAQKLH